MKLIIHQKWYLQQVKDTFTSLQAPHLNWALRNALNTAAKQSNALLKSKLPMLHLPNQSMLSKVFILKKRRQQGFLRQISFVLEHRYFLNFLKQKNKTRRDLHNCLEKTNLAHVFIKDGSFPKRVDLKKMKGNVFQRADGDQFPIAKQEEPSIARVMSKPEITSAIAQYANERLTKNIQRQLSRQEYAANKKG